MEADICTPPMARVVMDWEMACHETHGEKAVPVDSRSHLHSHSHSHSHPHSHPHSHSHSSHATSHAHLHSPHSPSSSPSFSSESESYPLSPCSSISSLTSVYSISSDSDIDDESDAPFLVSILKKPRYIRRPKKQGGSSSRQGSGHPDSRNSHDGNDYNHNSIQGGKGVDDTIKHQRRDEEGCIVEREDEWQECDDEESECEIIFERNVTFDEPLAIDIVTGAPVAPSSRSREEWAALMARERLERSRGLGEAWAFDEEGEGKVDWELGRSEEEDLAAEAEGSLRVDNTPERLLGDENKCNDLCEGARETGENHDVDLQEYVLGITEAVCCFVDHQQEQRLLQQR